MLNLKMDIRIAFRIAEAWLVHRTCQPVGKGLRRPLSWQPRLTFAACTAVSVPAFSSFVSTGEASRAESRPCLPTAHVI